MDADAAPHLCLPASIALLAGMASGAPFLKMHRGVKLCVLLAPSAPNVCSDFLCACVSVHVHNHAPVILDAWLLFAAVLKAQRPAYIVMPLM